MTFKIFKYEIPLTDYFQIDLPVGAKIMHLGVQANRPVIWAQFEVNETAKEPRLFRMIGTGAEFGENPALIRHIGTFEINSRTTSPFVGHVYELLGGHRA